MKVIDESWGRSTNGPRLTRIVKTDYGDVLQVVVDADSYDPQCHVAARPIDKATGTWATTPLVWRQGGETRTHRIERMTMTGGFVSHDGRSFRDHEREAMIADAESAVELAVEILREASS